MASKHEIIVADYQGFAVSFTDDDWFNATAVAAPFQKRPVDWLRLPDAERYIEVLCRKNEVEKSHFVKTTRGGDVSRQGTWLHPKLAVRFEQRCGRSNVTG